MRHNPVGSPWLYVALAAVAGAGVLHCSSSAKTTTETTTGAVSEALQSSSDSSDAVEAAGLMSGPDAFAPDAVEGFRCDASPVVTYVTVCGQSLPATTHLAWTDCEPPQGKGPRGAGPGAPPPALPDGGAPSMANGCPMPPAGACGADGGTCMAGGPPPQGPTSGTVDITNTYTTPSGCSAGIQDQQSVTFDVSRTDSDGEVFTVKGTTTSTEELTPGAPPFAKSTTIDITRTVTDASGSVERSVTLTGTRTETLSSATPPSRTVNSTLNAVFSDGTTSTVTATNVVYPPMSTCRWPDSGTLTQTVSDGTTHTLVYGPSCGSATLDGTVISLQDNGPAGGPGGPGGPSGNEGSGAPPPPPGR